MVLVVMFRNLDDVLRHAEKHANKTTLQIVEVYRGNDVDCSMYAMLCDEEHVDEDKDPTIVSVDFKDAGNWGLLFSKLFDILKNYTIIKTRLDTSLTYEHIVNHIWPRDGDSFYDQKYTKWNTKQHDL